MIKYNNLLIDVPSVYYIDIKNPKQALFKLLDTGDHIISYIHDIIKDSNVIDSYNSGENIYYMYTIEGCSSVDVISEIKSNADDILIRYSSCCISKNDTILTCTLFTEQPSIILVYKKINKPEKLSITMTCSLLPVNIYNKILNNKIYTDTCVYENGTVNILS